MLKTGFCDLFFYFPYKIWLVFCKLLYYTKHINETRLVTETLTEIFYWGE